MKTVNKICEVASVAAAVGCIFVGNHSLAAVLIGLAILHHLQTSAA